MKYRSDKERCENCKFSMYDDFDDEETTGAECRKHAPTIITSIDDVYGTWPLVHPDAWCGEFEQRWEIRE